MTSEVTLPELGENLDSGDVVKVLVSVGDTITRDQPIVELETDKATLEVPSPTEGIVSSIAIAVGDTIKVGQTILVVEPGSESESSEGAAHAAAPAASGSAPVPAPDPVPVPAPETTAALAAPAASAPAPPLSSSSSSSSPSGSRLAPAAPSVRRLARELGVDIARVTGSGTGGRVSLVDVKRHVKAVMTGAVAARGGPAVEPLPDFAAWGPIERQRLSAIRRSVARHLSRAWTEIPHVTQHDKADVTGLEKLRKQYAPRVEAAGAKLTVTAIVIKAVASVLDEYPQFNSSVDLAAGELILKRYIHIGVAVDTERGLLVPVLRDVDRKGITELSVELATLAARARERKLSRAEMQGGTFTITNLGGVGGTSFTPIVNHPEVAILGLSRSAQEPTFVNGEFQPRLMLPLSLSYDHRVIDGADAARFLRRIVEALEEPFTLAL